MCRFPRSERQTENPTEKREELENGEFVTFWASGENAPEQFSLQFLLWWFAEDNYNVLPKMDGSLRHGGHD